MNPTTADKPQFADQFKANFAAIAPLILEEWSNLDADQLETTGGNLEQVVEAVAIATDHTRTLIRRQLQELYQVAAMELTKSPSLTRELHQFVNKHIAGELAGEHFSDVHLKRTLAHLEERTEKLLHHFKQEMMPELSEKVQKNPVGSLLTALGIGFVLGVLVGGKRGR